MTHEYGIQRSHPPTDEMGDFTSGLLWFLKGFIYPCGSGSFYQAASKKRLIVVVLFFVVFAFVLTCINTVRIGLAMKDVENDIEMAYESGDFPTITIENGIAHVNGPQPLILAEEARTIIAVDTTGVIREIDTRAYSQGILLTRTELHMVNEDGYQTMPLIDLQEIFGNPIVIDEDQILNLWGRAALLIPLVASVGIFIWNSLVRFAYIALLGIAVWGILSIKQQGISYSPVLITGIYANVPTVYLQFMLGQVGIGFCGLYTILLIIIWVIALSVVLKDTGQAGGAEASGVVTAI